MSQIEVMSSNIQTHIWLLCSEIEYPSTEMPNLSVIIHVMRNSQNNGRKEKKNRKSEKKNTRRRREKIQME